MAKKAKAAKAAKKKTAKVKVPRKPRQKSLPGMEDRGIAEIERAAHAYVEARDARMQMGEEETRRHTKLVAVMKKHGKKNYIHRDGGEIIDVRMTVKDPEEKAKVKIKPVDEYKADATTEEPAATGDQDATDLEVGAGEEGSGIE